MVSLNTVIESLEMAYRYSNVDGGNTLVPQALVIDAIELLKAQVPKPPVIKENSYGWKFYYCPSCGKEFYQNNKFNFCEKCGQAVKWE